MLIQVQNFWRKNAIFFSIMLMLFSMFVSRALFSTFTIVFVAACCLQPLFIQQAKRWFSTPLLVAVSLLFIIPFISGLWSTNTDEWLKILRVKLPLLLFPLAFAGSWQLSRQQWKFVLLLILVTGVVSTSYSCIQYLIDSRSAHEAYLQAKVISTPFQDDHIRFSVFVALAFLASIFLVEYGYKALRVIGVLLAIWFAVYLHILAARTGLLCIYTITIAYLLRILFVKSNFTGRFLLVAAIVALPAIAWFAFPTFQNRVHYFLYDHSFARTNTYLPGSTDGNRILSMKAGWQIIRENPLGVGAGDVKPRTEAWYKQNVPGMLETDGFYPSSEWLMHGGMAGWAGIILFTAIMLFPFFVRHRYRFFFCLINLTLLLSLLFDTGLGVQYGVFLYAFFILAFWKWSRKEASIADSFS